MTSSSYTKTKFYSFHTVIDHDDPRESKNDATFTLANELETVLGNAKLLSLTSAASNGVLVTTMAYEEE